MHRMRNVPAWTRVGILLLAAATARVEAAVGPAFSYQGRLKQAGQPVDGTVSLTLSLWDDPGAGSPPVGGKQIGLEDFLPAVQVNDGVFTALVNTGNQFGPQAFDGNARWLQISVNGVVLAPRQYIGPAPYALAVPGMDRFSLDAADGNPLDAVYVDNLGRVGIGTTSPQVSLHVRADKPAVRIEEPVPGAKQWELLAEGNSRLLLRERTGGTQFLRFDQDGRIMIGDVLPSGDLNFGGGSYFKGSIGVNLQPKQGLALAVSGDTALDGKLGIGLTEPLTPLHVKGTARVGVLEITGGADIAEPFDVRAAESIRPGMVVSIDPEHVGELRLASTAYDPAVAGIISGANGVNPGLILKQEGSAADGKHPVALTGRVWCWCDADAGGPILPGTLLTTSNTPGHAMKAADAEKSRGATLGKAMSRLERGKGLVLVLVNLQ